MADKDRRIRRRPSSGSSRSVERTSLKMGANVGEEQIKRRKPTNKTKVNKNKSGFLNKSSSKKVSSARNSYNKDSRSRDKYLKDNFSRDSYNKEGYNSYNNDSHYNINPYAQRESHNSSRVNRESHSSEYYSAYDRGSRRSERSSSSYERDREKTPSRKSKHKQAKRNSGNGAKKFAFVVFTVIFIYIGVVGYNFITRETIPYDTIAYGSIDTPKSVVGIIVRDEKVYKATGDGSISFNVADMQKVRKGESICSIKNVAVVDSMEKELEEINKNILDIQDKRDDLSVFSEDVKRINSQIKSIVDDNVFDLSFGDISKLYYLNDNIKKKIDTKNQMLLSDSGGSLQELADKKSQREDEINKNTTVITSQEGGIVSYSFDGLEDTLSVDKLDSLTQEQTLMKQNDEKVEQAGGQVKKDSNIFKIINSNDWYVACYIPNDYITDWKEGDTRTVYIKNNAESVPMEAQIYKLNAGDKKSYVVLCLTKDIMDYINQRSITIELNKAQSGYKISNNAIVEIHSFKIPVSYIRDDNVILKKTDDGITEMTISTSGTDKEGNYAYIPVEYGGLNGDDKLVNPNNKDEIYELSSKVETTKGIYVINTGVTQFKTISLENSVQNSTHTILDPKENDGIKVYDRIVTDVKNVSKEQKVYS